VRQQRLSTASSKQRSQNICSLFFAIILEACRHERESDFARDPCCYVKFVWICVETHVQQIDKHSAMLSNTAIQCMQSSLRNARCVIGTDRTSNIRQISHKVCRYSARLAKRGACAVIKSKHSLRAGSIHLRVARDALAVSNCAYESFRIIWPAWTCSFVPQGTNSHRPGDCTNVRHRRNACCHKRANRPTHCKYRRGRGITSTGHVFCKSVHIGAAIKHRMRL